MINRDAMTVGQVYQNKSAKPKCIIYLEMLYFIQV